jgi:hypothetical protein
MKYLNRNTAYKKQNIRKSDFIAMWTVNLKFV